MQLNIPKNQNRDVGIGHQKFKQIGEQIMIIFIALMLIVGSMMTLIYALVGLSWLLKKKDEK
jgi:hypothetical protein